MTKKKGDAVKGRPPGAENKPEDRDSLLAKIAELEGKGVTDAQTIKDFEFKISGNKDDPDEATFHCGTCNQSVSKGQAACKCGAVLNWSGL